MGRVRRTAVVGLGVAALALSAIPQGVQARSVDPWREAAGHHDYGSTVVAAVSPTSAFSGSIFGTRNITRLKQWDGQSWTNATGIARPHSRLFAIDAVSPDDAFAVGYQKSRDGEEDHPLVIHWDGSTWNVVHIHHLGKVHYLWLYDVAMVAPDDVWIVGTDEPFNFNPIRSIILHWDGSAWRKLEAPTEATLYSVTALPSGDVWIGANDAFHDFIMHWDGQAWDFSPAAGYITSLDALSAKDVWAVGTQGSTRQTLTEHWDGKRWTVVPSPSPGESGTFLYDVSAVSANDVWTAGHTGYPSADYGDTLIEHWDGTEWAVVPSPSPGSHWNSLRGISADSATDAWAAGTFSNVDGTEQAKTLLLHWDGTTWSRLHDVR